MQEQIIDHGDDYCLIFDVDNVLIDTDRSFPWVIRTSIQWLWKFYLNRDIDCIAFTWEHFRTIKGFPQFNDDYDIAWFLINAAATRNIRSLRESFPHIDEIVNILTDFGEEDVQLWVKNLYGETVPRRLTRKLCAELYYGSEDFQKISGKEPTFVRCPGFWKRERPHINIHWKDFPVPVGIYTGRYRDELDLALKLLGWDDFPSELAVTGDSGITKPSPEGLRILCRRMHKKIPIYFGDAESDRKSLENLGFGTFVAIGKVLTDYPRRYQDLQRALSDLRIVH